MSIEIKSDSTYEDKEAISDIKKILSHKTNDYRVSCEIYRFFF